MIVIMCKECGKVLVVGKKLTGAIIYRDFDVNGEIDRGVMCKNCGHRISERRLREVISRENVKSRSS